MNTPAPDTIGGLSVAWIDNLATEIRRKGCAFRAGAGLSIEIQSINTSVFMPICLEGRQGNDCHFATEADRDAVLAALQSRTIETEL